MESYIRNADHFIVVKFDGDVWKYDTNWGRYEFTPVASDLLVADMDFTADTIVSAEGRRGTVHGIEYGYDTGDLVFHADMWNGSPDDGDFWITGSFFLRDGIRIRGIRGIRDSGSTLDS